MATLKGMVIMITLDKIYHAKYILNSVIRDTDVIYAPHINEALSILTMLPRPLM